MHIDWNAVYFDSNTISGSVTHDMYVIEDTDYITFDIWNQDILSVTQITTGAAKEATKAGRKVKKSINDVELSWSTQEPDPISG